MILTSCVSVIQIIYEDRAPKTPSRTAPLPFRTTLDPDGTKEERLAVGQAGIGADDV